MEADKIHLDDIAHALSNSCRFSGHCKWHYSVAQHSILVSVFAEKMDKKAALAGLLHDAAEAYLLDIPKPLKDQVEMKPYRNAENKMMKMIFDKYNVTFNKDVMEIVKKSDRLALQVEINNLMPTHEGFEYLGETDLRHTIKKMYPEEAEKLFKERFFKVIKYER